MENPIEILDQTQAELEQVAEEVEYFTGVGRREFVFRSLVIAAASTFGVAAAARAQGGGRAAGAGGAPQQAPSFPQLGNGEPISWTFQPYPGGTGAMMQKLLKERGAKAFERSVFTVAPWTGPVPTSDDEIAFLPAHRLSALIHAKKLTSANLTDIYLTRLKRLDPTLLCAVTILETRAREEAARADAELAAGKSRGPLHGIPYGVKDLFSVKGAPTTWGVDDFKDRVIDDDSEVVLRLRDAGAVLVAKLASGRFASGDNWFRGQTKNPWDTRRGSSGSSAGPSSATAAGCVAFGIGTETSGSIVSPSRECGLSALRPTFGRVSRYGGMVLAWSQDRVGPICRTIEDAAMVFNTIHGVDEKDPGTVTVPFQFDRNIKLASLRIGADPTAPKEFVDKLRELGATIREIGPRPTVAGGNGGGLGVEGAAAFEFYVEMKAKEFGVDLATVPEPVGRGGGRGRGAPPDSAAAAAARGGGRGAGGRGADPNNPMAGVQGFNGRFTRAFDFIQAQRRRYVLISKMAEFMKDLDMYVPALPAADIAYHASTGHPCAVVPYKFEPQPTGRGGGRGRGGAADTTAGRATEPPVVYNPQPICAVLAGNLFNDDKILSVAHQYQIHTDWHTRHPSI